MKVCFFIWAIYAAGAERVLSILANRWAEEGWDVVIMTMAGQEFAPFYPLAPSIKLRPLNLLKESDSFLSAIINNIKRILSVRRAIKEARPDVVISFIDKASTLAILATRGLGSPIIISERTDPSRRSLGFIWENLRNLAYPRADLIVFQSQDVMDWFPPPIRARGVVIPNPVPLPPPPPPIAPSKGSIKRLVSVGRLAPVKGFDILVRAFAAAVERVPHWRLDVWGEGSERGPLEKLVNDLGMADHIRFCGITNRPFDVLREADLFVLASHAEGFPNALAEAMACGLPVISTQFGGAASDIIQNGVNGLLVPPNDPKALAEALIHLMSDPDEQARLGREASKVVERFSTDQVLAMWEMAVNQVVKREGKLSSGNQLSSDTKVDPRDDRNIEVPR